MTINNAGDGSGNSSSGNGAGIPSATDGVNVEQLVNEAVNKALGARMKRLDLGSQIEAAVQAALSKAGHASDKPQQPEGGNDATPERQSLKTLTDELNRLRKQMSDQQAATERAQQQARDEKIRGQLHSKLASKLSADNPLIGTLIDSLYDVKKRVIEQDGRIMVKFADQYGNEDLKPLDDGIAALFDGEYKHLVQQSKAQNLPPASFVRGAPMSANQQQAQPSNPFYREIAKSALAENPALAAQLAAANPQK